MANTTYFVKGNRVVDSNGDAVVIINGNELTTTDKFPSGGGGDIEQLEEDVERALLGEFVYNTNERECGEWIDGKPLFTKTIHYRGEWNRFNEHTLASGVDRLVKAEQTLVNRNSSSASYLVGRVSGSTSSFDETMQVVIKNDNTVYAYALDTWVDVECDITLWYTKVD